MPDFLGTIRATIQKYRMLRRKERVVVGVSGGPDSLALLCALVALREELKLHIRAAYVDHGLRPSEVRREIALVKKLGRLWGVPVQIVRRSVRKSGGQSLEEAARTVRYEALESLARRHRCGTIALGHTQDDQAETVLMWLLRGAGTDGLAGIPPVREAEGARRCLPGNSLNTTHAAAASGPPAAARIPRPRRGPVLHDSCLKIVRPLIRCSRVQVEAHLKTQGIQPLKDSTNDSPRFFRNRIRHELIPWLEREFNPRVRQHLAQLAEIVRADLDWMNREVAKEFRHVARRDDGEVRLNRERLRRAPEALRRSILRLAVERLQGNRNGFGVRHWQRLEELLLNGALGGLDLPHRIRAEVGDARWLRLVAPASIWYTKRRR